MSSSSVDPGDSHDISSIVSVQAAFRAWRARRAFRSRIDGATALQRAFRRRLVSQVVIAAQRAKRSCAPHVANRDRDALVAALMEHSEDIGSLPMAVLHAQAEFQRSRGKTTMRSSVSKVIPNCSNNDDDGGNNDHNINNNDSNNGDATLLPALHVAAMIDYEDAVKVLLDDSCGEGKGGSELAAVSLVKGKDAGGYTAAERAASVGATASCVYIMRHSRSLGVPPRHSGPRALHIAAIADYPELLCALLGVPADQPSGPIAHTLASFEVSHTDADGVPAVSTAAFLGNTRCVQVLIDVQGGRKVIASARDTMGRTALHAAIAGGKPAERCVRLILESGADSRAADAHDRTPLHWCARYPSVTNVKTLVRAGAKVDARDDTGATPALAAASMGSIAVMDALIENGASTTAVDKAGRGLLHLATTCRGQYTSKLAIEAVIALSDDGRDSGKLDAQDADGTTPLAYACVWSKPAAAMSLLAAGASVTRADRYGMTPLHWASIHALPGLVGALVRAGADPAAKTVEDAPELRGAMGDVIDGPANPADFLRAVWPNCPDTVSEEEWGMRIRECMSLLGERSTRTPPSVRRAQQRRHQSADGEGNSNSNIDNNNDNNRGKSGRKDPPTTPTSRSGKNKKKERGMTSDPRQRTPGRGGDDNSTSDGAYGTPRRSSSTRSPMARSPALCRKIHNDDRARTPPEFSPVVATKRTPRRQRSARRYGSSGELNASSDSGSERGAPNGRHKGGKRRNLNDDSMTQDRSDQRDDDDDDDDTIDARDLRRQRYGNDGSIEHGSGSDSDDDDDDDHEHGRHRVRPASRGEIIMARAEQQLDDAEDAATAAIQEMRELKRLHAQRAMQRVRKDMEDAEDRETLLRSLHDLVKANDPAGVSSLLDAFENRNIGIDEPPSKWNNQTALHVAAMKNHIAVARVLVEAGASVSALDVSGSTPLHYACAEGSLLMVKLLVRAGGRNEVNRSNEVEGCTALHIAARFDKADVATFLLAQGAKRGLLDRHGRTALRVAQYYRARAAARAILKSDRAVSTFHASIRTHNMAHLQRLLRKRRSLVRSSDYSGLSALHTAAVSDNPQAMRLLLTHGADLADGSPNHHARTPLHLAAEKGLLNSMDILLAAGAETDARDAYGMAPLHIAAGGAALIVAASSASSSDGSGKGGSAVGGPDAMVMPVMTTSASSGSGTGISGSTSTSASSGGEVAVRVLVMWGADVDAQDDAGRTPAHVAAAGGSVPVLRRLIREGADPEAVDNEGRSLMRVAMEAGRDACVLFLRDMGVSIDVGVRRRRRGRKWDETGGGDHMYRSQHPEQSTQPQQHFYYGASRQPMDATDRILDVRKGLAGKRVDPQHQLQIQQRKRGQKPVSKLHRQQEAQQKLQASGGAGSRQKRRELLRSEHEQKEQEVREVFLRNGGAARRSRSASAKRNTPMKKNRSGSDGKRGGSRKGGGRGESDAVYSGAGAGEGGDGGDDYRDDRGGPGGPYSQRRPASSLGVPYRSSSPSGRQSVELDPNPAVIDFDEDGDLIEQPQGGGYYNDENNNKGRQPRGVSAGRRSRPSSSTQQLLSRQSQRERLTHQQQQDQRQRDRALARPQSSTAAYGTRSPYHSQGGQGSRGPTGRTSSSRASRPATSVGTRRPTPPPPRPPSGAAAKKMARSQQQQRSAHAAKKGSMADSSNPNGAPRTRPATASSSPSVRRPRTREDDVLDSVLRGGGGARGGPGAATTLPSVGTEDFRRTIEALRAGV